MEKKRGQKIGFKHSEESKEKIGEGAKGVGRGGFNVKIDCPICQQQMSPANLGKHLPACKEFTKHRPIFGKEFSTIRQFKHFKGNLRRGYKMSLNDYIELFTSQNGVCSICKSPPAERGLFVDHCHDTDRIRGLLCSQCNMALELFKDSVESLKSSIDYLQSR
jgi:hypothetical protein